jgi:hypothetical protein
MIAALRFAGQFIVIVALFAAVAAFADWPRYREIPPGTGAVVLTFVHGAERSCRRLSAEEIARLAPNMRKAEVCARARRPLRVELDLGERPLLRADLPPTGIAGDGPSRVYRRFVVPAGEHDIKVRLRDTARTEGFDYEAERHVVIAAAQLLVIDFQAGQFVFR